MNLQFWKMNERMMKEGNPLIQCCNNSSSTKQMLNNDQNYCSKKKRNGSKFSAVVPKIGGILSSACGMSRNVKERIILAGDDEEEEDEEVRVGRREGRGRRKGFHIKKWKKGLVRSGSGYYKSGIAGEKKMEEEEGGEGVELCKKRILMGEKCRPLNLSGALHYDEDGIILVEFHR